MSRAACGEQVQALIRSFSPHSAFLFPLFACEPPPDCQSTVIRAQSSCVKSSRAGPKCAPCFRALAHHFHFAFFSACSEASLCHLRSDSHDSFRLSSLFPMCYSHRRCFRRLQKVSFRCTPSYAPRLKLITSRCPHGSSCP